VSSSVFYSLVYRSIVTKKYNRLQYNGWRFIKVFNRRSGHPWKYYKPIQAQVFWCYQDEYSSAFFKVYIKVYYSFGFRFIIRFPNYYFDEHLCSRTGYSIEEFRNQLWKYINFTLSLTSLITKGNYIFITTERDGAKILSVSLFRAWTPNILAREVWPSL